MSSTKPRKPAPAPMAFMEPRVDVTRIADGLVRLDVYDERGQGSAVLTKEQAKKIAVALARA